VATPGRIFERLEQNYPSEPEVQQEVQASVQAESPNERSATLAVNSGRQRILYKSKDAKRLVMIGPDHLAVSSLEPYEGWKKFSNRIKQARADIGTILTLPRVEQVSVRYLNRIVIQSDTIETNDYFNISIQTAQNGAAKLGSFISRVESVVDERTRVNRIFASLESQANESAVLLDIEVMRNFTDAVTISDAFKELDLLRRLKNAEFESAITDRTRELFQ
jgi:uncharacterized protein (TIGR04255 family)